VIFLVAAGTLMPFAKACIQNQAVEPPRLASPMLQRVLPLAIEHRGRRAIPSETLGNGVDIQPIEALAITEWLAGADGVETLAARVAAGINRLNLDVTIDSKTPRPGDELVTYAQVAAADVLENLLPSLMRLGLIS
jgi:hypothetical protein